LIQTIENQLTI